MLNTFLNYNTGGIPGNRKKEILLNTAMGPHAVSLVVVICNCIVFFFSGAIGPGRSVLFLLAGSIFYLWILIKNKMSSKWIFLIFMFWLVAGSGAIFWASRIYDYSADGQIYHQEAIIQLAEGWNPVMDPETGSGPSQAIWSHYPKTLWIVYASIYSMTGHIQSAKGFNIIMILSLFLLSCYFFLRILPKNNVWVIVFSCLVILNPVVIGQVNTYYLDGVSYLLLMVIVECLILLAFEEKRMSAWILFSSSVFLINTKFTMLVYAVFLVAAFAAGLYIFGKKALAKKLIPGLVLTMAFNVFFIGFDPYIHNLVHHGHPFYPVMGAGKTDVITWLRPEGYNNISGIARFLDAHFLAPARWDLLGLKLYAGSYGNFYKNGLGPLFTWYFLASLVTVMIWFRRLSDPRLRIFIFVYCTLFVSVLINPEAWMARYVPQFWILPLLPFIYLIAMNDNFLNLRRASAFGIVFILTFQLLHFAANSYINIKTSRQIRDQLSRLAVQKETIGVYLGQTASVRKRLDESAIPYLNILPADTAKYESWHTFLAARSKYTLMK